jgi:NAD(P)-dependent dehydrogenase (short-subunit alcohol dehydrogenase family)
MTSKQDITGANFTRAIHHTTYAALELVPGSLPSQFHACILGASRDIGANIAYSFAQAGAAAIAICAPQAEIDVSPIPARLRELNPSVRLIYLPCDLTVSSEVERYTSQIAYVLGHLDALVYNAGYFGPWETRTASTPFDFSLALDVNCKGLYLATHFMLPLLKRCPGRGGSVISICSVGMHATGGPGTNTAYGISKLAQYRFLEMLAATEPDIFTAAVHPGNVKTEMGRHIPPELYNGMPSSVLLCLV